MLDDITSKKRLLNSHIEIFHMAKNKIKTWVFWSNIFNAFLHLRLKPRWNRRPKIWIRQIPDYPDNPPQQPENLGEKFQNTDRSPVTGQKQVSYQLPANKSFVELTILLATLHNLLSGWFLTWGLSLICQYEFGFNGVNAFPIHK